jgi:hypothetical protein
MQESDDGPDLAPWSEVIVEVALNPGSKELVFPPHGEPTTCAHWCMSAQRMRLLKRYVSRDGSKQIYVFSAPDTDGVRRVVEAYFGTATARLDTWPTRG